MNTKRGKGHEHEHHHQHDHETKTHQKLSQSQQKFLEIDQGRQKLIDQCITKDPLGLKSKPLIIRRNLNCFSKDYNPTASCLFKYESEQAIRTNHQRLVRHLEVNKDFAGQVLQSQARMEEASRLSKIQYKEEDQKYRRYLQLMEEYKNKDMMAAADRRLTEYLKQEYHKDNAVVTLNKDN